MTDGRREGQEQPVDVAELDDAVSDADEYTIPTRVTEVLVTEPAPRERDRATLTVVSGPETGRVYSLSDNVVIGRGKECEVRVDDGSISRQHASIARSGSGLRWDLEDLRSRNGTFVDGYRVRRHALRDGDRLQLGGAIHLRFSITDDVEEKLQRRLYESSVRDGLTGTFNRKHFNERLSAEISFALRHSTPVALLIFDIDHFKRVNDEHGHLAGDKALRELSSVVMHTIRAEDILARYGGEEFAVIARGVETEGAIALAERIRGVAQALRTDFEGATIAFSVSVGVAMLSGIEGTRDATSLIARADERLYQAKRAGRNRVVGPAVGVVDVAPRG